MGDFVSKEEIEKIREHYHKYIQYSDWQKNDNRGRPASGIYDADSFREVSTHYINRLLRYIDIEEVFQEFEKTEVK